MRKECSGEEIGDGAADRLKLVPTQLRENGKCQDLLAGLFSHRKREIPVAAAAKGLTMDRQVIVNRRCNSPAAQLFPHGIPILCPNHIKAEGMPCTGGFDRTVDSGDL